MSRILSIAATILLVSGASTAAHAAAVVGFSSAATPGLTGFSTYTFNLSSDVAGETFTSLQGDFQGATINQINPFDLATIFQDNNGAITGTGGDVLQDSQFLFNTATDGLLLAGVPSESTSNLAATFTGFPSFESRSIAQVVLLDGIQGTADMTVVLNGQEVTLPTQTFGVPEPGSLLLAAVGAGLGLEAIRRNRRR